MKFHFAECFDYLKAGIEAIIEDEVTSRFEAEELKSWNLLTRTNRRYEFINWRITLIWMIGFTIRYTILMPLRVLVCFVGVSRQSNTYHKLNHFDNNNLINCNQTTSMFPLMIRV